MWQALLGDLCDVCVFQLGADKSSPCYEINRCTGKTGLQSAAIVKDHDTAISIYFNQFHLNWLLGLSKASKMWDSWHFAATWCLQDWCSWQGLGTQGWQPRALIPTLTTMMMLTLTLTTTMMMDAHWWADLVLAGLMWGVFGVFRGQWNLLSLCFDDSSAGAEES